MYLESDLVALAKRENNKKRNYLVVNKRQGKHIAVSPTLALKTFSDLAKQIIDAEKDSKILFVGFAETATAIGAQVAITVGGKYMHTTREQIPGVEYLYFTESHSHATEQKLVKDDIDAICDDVDKIIFVEDEVTTGNTILKIINILDEKYPGKFEYGVASLLNGMNQDSLDQYKKRNIDLYYLVKTNHDAYPEIADKFVSNNNYIQPDFTSVNTNILNASNYVNARRLVDTSEYLSACENLWNQVSAQLDIETSKSYLVCGTEEFMFPAIYVGKRLEEEGCTVKTHSTTRSPIVVSADEDYPLHQRFELRSLYDDDRVTYIYDIRKYDSVIIVTDSKLNSTKGLNSLVNAAKSQNTDIKIVRWC